MDFLIFFIIGIVILMALGLLFKLSLGIIIKLVMNAVVGGIIIFLLNFFGEPLGIYIDLNIFSAIIVGMFGVVGIILLLIFG